MARKKSEGGLQCLSESTTEREVSQSGHKHTKSSWRQGIAAKKGSRNKHPTLACQVKFNARDRELNEEVFGRRARKSKEKNSYSQRRESYCSGRASQDANHKPSTFELLAEQGINW